jgi:hypothetical protein
MSVMHRVLVWPVVVVVVAVVAVGVAFVLDSGGSAQRDAALLVGTAGLWVLAVGLVWLVAALGYLGYLAYRHRRPPRS